MSAPPDIAEFDRDYISPFFMTIRNA